MTDVYKAIIDWNGADSLDVVGVRTTDTDSHGHTFVELLTTQGNTSASAILDANDARAIAALLTEAADELDPPNEDTIPPP